MQQSMPSTGEERGIDCNLVEGLPLGVREEQLERPRRCAARFCKRGSLMKSTAIWTVINVGTGLAQPASPPIPGCMQTHTSSLRCRMKCRRSGSRGRGGGRGLVGPSPGDCDVLQAHGDGQAARSTGPSLVFTMPCGTGKEPVLAFLPGGVMNTAGLFSSQALLPVHR